MYLRGNIVHKIFITILLTFILALGFGISSQAGIDKLNYDGSLHEYKTLPIFLKVNGEDVDSPMPPIVFGEYSLVPAREVFESLGATVTWNDKSEIAKISYNDTKIYLTINNDMAKVDDRFEKLDIPAKIINDKTMIPTRFVSEQLGFNVVWDESIRTIYIANKPQSIKILSIKYISNPLSDTIKNVGFTPTDSKVVQVDITSNEEIKEYSSHFLKDPYRLVLDINDSVLTVTDKNIPVDENGIDQIRTSQFEINPDKTRVVVDLQNPLKYNIYLSSDKKHLKVDFVTNESNIPIDVIDNNDKQDDGEYVVVIDPGHGGSEPGAIYSSIYEKNLNLDIALRLEKLLKDKKIEVFMIRNDDSTFDLMERAPYSNSIKPDLFISIHNNAMEDSSFDGTMTLYNPNKQPDGLSNLELAKIIQNALLNKTGTTDRGVRERPGLAVLKYSDYPSILVEVAFMTNNADMLKLKDNNFKQSAAQGLCDGIVQALKEKNN